MVFPCHLMSGILVHPKLSLWLLGLAVQMLEGLLSMY